MKNFNKKVEYLNTIFIYKFKLYDRLNTTYKIYYFSPDGVNSYLSVNYINNGKEYACEFGDLIFNDVNQFITLEPKELFQINQKDFEWFKKYHDKQPLWLDNKIYEIIESFKIIKMGLF